jgi:CheY-like chemotaxis protein
MSLAELGVLEPLHLSERHTVLLVDDDPAVLSALQRLLREEPYEIRATTDPQEALRRVRQGGVSLVVVDQRMPGMAGTEFLDEVRGASPRTLRVLLTGYPSTAVVRYALADDVHWLIRKPWNDNALRLAIRCLLHSLEAKPPPEGTAPPEAGGPRAPEGAACTDERGPGKPLARAWRTAARGARKGFGGVLAFFGLKR